MPKEHVCFILTSNLVQNLRYWLPPFQEKLVQVKPGYIHKWGFCSSDEQLYIVQLPNLAET